MPVCPVCENPQVQGDACDVCGRELPRAERAVEVPRLDGLEPTAHDLVPAGHEVVPELEPTHAPPVDVPAGAVEGLQPTAHASGNGSGLAPEPLEDLEPTAADPIPGASTPGPVLCRYCRTAATAAETMCLRCGMRLPRPRARAEELAPQRRNCSDCGTPFPGNPCRACGARQAGG